MDLGLLLIRLVVGGLLAGHGIQKLFGRLGGFGLTGTGGYLETFGLRPGRLFALFAGTAELTAGVLLISGLATPIAALLAAATMLVATRTDHAGKGLWIFNGGAEYAVTVLAVAVGVAIVGPGALSVDHAFGLRLEGVEVGVAALALGVAGAMAVLASRGRGPAPMGDQGASMPTHEADGSAM